MRDTITREIALPDTVTAQLHGSILKIKGPQGEVERNFAHPKVQLTVEHKIIKLQSNQGTRREKTIIGSFESHIKNLVQGVQEPHIYKLKICSGHFPMNVAVVGQELVIKNFLGESVPRRITFIKGAEVKIDGTDIVVSSPDKEAAGQTAARIESLCRITNRDIRVFQDGCHIFHKAGKGVA